MTAAGWYDEPGDPALSRYFDGLAWTQHTIVKAEWAGPGAPPPPPGLAPPTAPVRPAPPAWTPPPTTSTLPPPQAVRAAGTPGLADRYRAWPRWGRIAAPVAAAFLVLGVIGSTMDDKDTTDVATSGGSTTSSTVHQPTDAERLAAAVTAASSSLENPPARPLVQEIIEGYCDHDLDQAAATVAGAAADTGEISDLVGAGKQGATQYCPDDVEAQPTASSTVLNGAMGLWNARLATTTTTVAATAPPATTPTTTRATTQPTTATTKRPATTTTVASGGNCSPNYSGCLDPNASDYDCRGGSGNGPKYTGEVRVIGTDVWDLDSDGDGIGCNGK